MTPTLPSHPHATPGSGAVLAAPVLPGPPRMPVSVLRMLPDDRLAAMVQSGSEPAFEALFDRHHRTVLAFCRALGDFGITLMVAGSIPGLTQTTPLAIYDLVQSNRMAEANALSLIAVATVALLLMGLGRLARLRF